MLAVWTSAFHLCGWSICTLSIGAGVTFKVKQRKQPFVLKKTLSNFNVIDMAEFLPCSKKKKKINVVIKVCSEIFACHKFLFVNLSPVRCCIYFLKDVKYHESKKKKNII